MKACNLVNIRGIRYYEKRRAGQKKHENNKPVAYRKYEFAEVWG